MGEEQDRANQSGEEDSHWSANFNPFGVWLGLNPNR